VVGPKLNSAFGELTDYSNIAQWRIVSQAMKFKLVNTDEENDGWWEACRIPYEAELDTLALADQGGDLSAGTHNTNHLALYREKIPIAYTDSMVEIPGYMCGLLKDLHKHEFKLQPTGCESHIQTVTQKLKLDPGDVQTDSLDNRYLLSTTGQAKEIERHLTDTSFIRSI